MALEWKRGTFTYDVVGLGHTITNAMNAISSFMTQCGWSVASWDNVPSVALSFVRTDWASNPYWRYTGDGPDQRCGIRFIVDGANNRIICRTFLENIAQSAMQVDSESGDLWGSAFLQLDATAPNNMLMIGGEGGFYLESGRDGSPTNLAMMMVVAWESVPAFNGTDNARLHYTTQGAVMDLFGQIRITPNWGQWTVVDTYTPGKLFTGYITPRIARGVTGLNGQVPVDHVNIGLGNRDTVIGLGSTEDGSNSNWGNTGRFTFFVPFSPRDGQYRIAPMMVDQTLERFPLGQNGSGSWAVDYIDVRALRNVPKFAAVDWTLIPFVNLTDQATSQTYRVGQVADNGHTANIGVVWPDNSNVVTITG